MVSIHLTVLKRAVYAQGEWVACVKRCPQKGTLQRPWIVRSGLEPTSASQRIHLLTLTCCDLRQFPLFPAPGQ